MPKKRKNRLGGIGFGTIKSGRSTKGGSVQWEFNKSKLEQNA
jgi:hypothetical protein